VCGRDYEHFWKLLLLLSGRVLTITLTTLIPIHMS